MVWQQVLFFPFMSVSSIREISLCQQQVKKECHYKTKGELLAYELFISLVQPRTWGTHPLLIYIGEGGNMTDSSYPSCKSKLILSQFIMAKDILTRVQSIKIHAVLICKKGSFGVIDWNFGIF